MATQATKAKGTDAGATEKLTAEKAAEVFLQFGTTEPNVPLIEKYYSPDVVFEDAIQRLEGRDAFIHMIKSFLGKADSLSVEIRDSAQNGDVIFLQWCMRLKAGKRSPVIPIEGATRFRLGADGKIIDHRDYYDLWGDALKVMPGIGPAYRRLVKRLG